MVTLRFSSFGADFRTLFQPATCKNLAAVENVAIYNQDRSEGECFASWVGVLAVYEVPEEVLRHEQSDLIDAFTYPFTFSPW
jgi:hypothetical protein